MKINQIIKKFNATDEEIRLALKESKSNLNDDVKIKNNNKILKNLKGD